MNSLRATCGRDRFDGVGLRDVELLIADLPQFLRDLPEDYEPPDHAQNDQVERVDARTGKRRLHRR